MTRRNRDHEKRTLVFLLFLAIFGIQSSQGQNSPSEPANQKRSVDESISELNDGNYAARQQATMEMWRNREQSRDAVQRAARHADPEISGRAEWILRQWRRGALPQTPPEISRLLADSDHSSAVIRLMENGQFDVAVVAMEESAGTPMREEIGRRVTSAMMQRFPLYVLKATEPESTASLLRLVDLAADTLEMALCRIRLMQHLNLPIDDQSLLPTSASAWPPIQQQRTKVVLLASLGRFDHAIRLAKESSETNWVTRCRMMSGHWKVIAREARQAAGESDPNSFAEIQRWSDTLVAASRCGDQDLVNEAVDHLKLSNEDADRLEADAVAVQADDQWKKPWNLRWRALAVHGRLAESMRILNKMDAHDASEIWNTTSHPAEAFRALGINHEDTDSLLHHWIDEALEEQSKYADPSLSPKSERLISLMPVLLTVGCDDAAWMIASRLSQSPAGAEGFRPSDKVLDALSLSRKTDWAFRLASKIDGSEESLSASRLDAIAGTLRETSEETLEVVLEALHTMFPRWSITRRVSAAGMLLRGKTPEGFDTDKDFLRLYDFVIRPRPTRILQQRLARTARLRANMEMVRMFSRLDQTELASATLRALAQSGDATAIFEMASLALDSGGLDGAEKVFQSICDGVSDVSSKTGTFGASANLAIAGKSLVGSWIVARSRGDDQRAAQIRNQIELLLCGPSRQLSRTVADYLSERGENQWATEIYEGMLVPQMFSEQESIGFYQDARRYALLANDQNPASAAKWFDLATIGIIGSDQFLPTAFVTLPVYVHRWSLEAAIAENDTVATEREVKRALMLDPMDIELAERLLPPMRQAGMVDLADKTLLAIIDRCELHAQQFGRDAVTANNIAWVAAVNQRHLDRALALSRQSVRHQPESAIYRDTLAEILYLIGQPGQALQIEQGCVLDDPGQWHLHQQIERFTK